MKGITILIVCLIIYLVFKAYNNIRAFALDLYHLVARVVKGFRKNSTALRIENYFSQVLKELRQQVPEANAPDIQIKWVKRTDELHDGDTFVRLTFSDNEIRNVVNTARLYIRKNILPIAKPYIKKEITSAIDFSLIRKFLLRTPRSRDAVKMYVRETSVDLKHIEEIIDKVERMDDAGLLTRLLLREYAVWGDKIAMRMPRREHEIESEALFEFVHKISVREHDERTPLRMVGKDIKVGVVLVAKEYVFANEGEDVYIRRINEGIALGIKTFYLLARDERIKYLDSLYKHIVTTYNLTLKNGAVEYKDDRKRNVKCYVIEVDDESELAKNMDYLKQAIKRKKIVNCIITDIKQDKICCVFHSIPIIIHYDQITVTPGLNLSKYYIRGASIEVLPLEQLNNGRFTGSLLATTSNPQSIIDLKYVVGGVVSATVTKVDTNTVTLKANDSRMTVICSKEDICLNPFRRLKDIVHVGQAFDLTIKEIDYIESVLFAELSALHDAWKIMPFSQGDIVVAEVLNNSGSEMYLDLPGGYPAVLPYNELTWFYSEQKRIKQNLLSSRKADVRIKTISAKSKIIVASFRELENPYVARCEALESNGEEPVISVKKITPWGIEGTFENVYKVVIPKEELRIGKLSFYAEMHKTYPFKILGVRSDGMAIEGSFKPYIEKPLQQFANTNYVGQPLVNLKLKEASDDCLLFSVKIGKKRYHDAFLFRSEITSLAFIPSAKDVFLNGCPFPLMIKVIDVNNDILSLSLKDVLYSNRYQIKKLDYTTNYEATVIAKTKKGYAIIVNKLKIESFLNTSSLYSIGQIITVRPERIGTGVPEFTDN